MERCDVTETFLETFPETQEPAPT